MHYRIIFSVFLFLFLSSCDLLFFKSDLSQILGIEKIEIENIQTFNEIAGIQGEGYILEIYTLSEKTIQAFINNPIKNLPDKQEEGKEWHKYNWSTFPIDSSYSEVFNMCLYNSGYNKKLKVKLNEIKRLIEKEGVYYSFYYRPDKEHLQNVQLFILDVQNRKLYAIDSQV
jgi:hypothetical protein